MKLQCITQGEGFLRYPDGAVTVGKIYDTFKDFETKMRHFVGDNGITYKVIPGFFIYPKNFKLT